MAHSVLTIVITCVISCLALWGEHYSPWKLWTGKALSRPKEYTLGMAAMMLPLSGLYLYWMTFPPAGNPLGWALGALAADVLASGILVIGLYHIDQHNLLKVKVNELDQLKDEMGLGKVLDGGRHSYRERLDE